MESALVLQQLLEDAEKGYSFQVGNLASGTSKFLQFVVQSEPKCSKSIRVHNVAFELEGKS